MDKWYSLLVLLAVGGGISAIRWWVEKQRREEEAREAAKRPQAPRATRRPPLSPSAVETVARGGVGSRTIFYGRPGEVPARAVDVVELRSSPPEPPPMEEVGALEKHHLEQPKARRASSIAGRQMRRVLEGRGMAALGTGATPKEALRGGRFVAEMLRPRHLAGAMIVREILGPPKSLEDAALPPR